MNCEACGAVEKIVMHHWDYDRDDDTIPMCGSCHVRMHRGGIPEPRTGRIYAMGEAYREAGITKRDGKLVRISDEQWDAVAILATSERRNVTQQLGVLVDEALAARAARAVTP